MKRPFSNRALKALRLLVEILKPEKQTSFGSIPSAIEMNMKAWTGAFDNSVAVVALEDPRSRSDNSLAAGSPDRTWTACS